MATDPHLGTRIRNRRQILGLSQQELAERIGVDRATVSNWERGRQRPLRYIGPLEQILSIPLSEDASPDPGPQDGDQLDVIEQRLTEALEMVRRRRERRQGGDTNASVRRYGT